MTEKLQEQKIVSEVLSGIAGIPRQNLTKEGFISKVLEIEPVKRVFAYRSDSQGNTLLGIIISLSGEPEPTRESRLIVEDITLRLN